MLAALKHVSEHVTRISLIAVVGAVNTLRHKPRISTRDVDLSSLDPNNARIVLDDATQDAQQRIPGLGTDWLNTETQIRIPGLLHQDWRQPPGSGTESTLPLHGDTNKEELRVAGTVRMRVGQ